MHVSLNEKYPSAKRPIVLFTDDDGTEVVRVGLRCGHSAVLAAEDFHRLMVLGVSPNWFLNMDGSGQFPYVRARISVANGWTGNLVTIARLIRPVPFRGLTVRYLDGCALNLRRKNIYMADRRSGAKGREWSLVKSSEIELDA